MICVYPRFDPTSLRSHRSIPSRPRRKFIRTRSGLAIAPWTTFFVFKSEARLCQAAFNTIRTKVVNAVPRPSPPNVDCHGIPFFSPLSRNWLRYGLVSAYCRLGLIVVEVELSPEKLNIALLATQARKGLEAA